MKNEITIRSNENNKIETVDGINACENVCSTEI